MDATAPRITSSEGKILRNADADGSQKFAVLALSTRSLPPLAPGPDHRPSVMVCGCARNHGEAAAYAGELTQRGFAATLVACPLKQWILVPSTTDRLNDETRIIESILKHHVDELDGARANMQERIRVAQEEHEEQEEQEGLNEAGSGGAADEMKEVSLDDDEGGVESKGDDEGGVESKGDDYDPSLSLPFGIRSYTFALVSMCASHETTEEFALYVHGLFNDEASAWQVMRDTAKAMDTHDQNLTEVGTWFGIMSGRGKTSYRDQEQQTIMSPPDYSSQIQTLQEMGIVEPDV
tara:strand:+ start:2246 stop:3127 length:882 start_codon:yes stop_codon:yes gene_type:complete